MPRSASPATPDGRLLSASLADASGEQYLRLWRVEDLLAGKLQHIGECRFGQAAPEGFVFSPDGKYLFGSAFYTGASNIFRYEVATGDVQAVSNAETGFFRPLPLADGRLVVFSFSGHGFQPAIIEPEVLKDLGAIRSLRAELAKNHPLVTTWHVPLPGATKEPPPAITADGDFHPARSLELHNGYPVLQGYKEIVGLGFTVVAVVLAAIRWKEIPSSEKEASIYSREFWIFLGATTLCLMGFQVLLPTSIPVYNSIVEVFGGESNLAPPADQIGFYSKFQLWFGVLVALISGTGQFFWWKRMEKDKLKKENLPPILMISLIVFAIIISIAKVYEPAYVVLTLAGVYLIISNLKVLSSVIKVNPSLSGGSLAHIGIGMMLIGVMFSSGYSKVVSLNNTGMLISKDLPTEFN